MMVEVDGVVKTSNGDYSSFFPKDYTLQQIVDSINEAFNNKVLVEGTMNIFEGVTSSGIKIQMYIRDGKIMSTFPIYKRGYI